MTLCDSFYHSSALSGKKIVLSRKLSLVPPLCVGTYRGRSASIRTVSLRHPYPFDPKPQKVMAILLILTMKTGKDEGS